MTKNRRVVCVVFDSDAEEDDVAYCSYENDGTLTKMPEYSEGLSKNSLERVIKTFLDLDLPFITYHDINPFEILDTEVKTMNLKFFRYKDAILERDIEISNDLGLKRKPYAKLESPMEHVYLPGMPNLVYEDYPFMKPDVEGSVELTNEIYMKKFWKPFEHKLKTRLASLTKSKSNSQLNYIGNPIFYQTPVLHSTYFSFSCYEFADVFMRDIFDPILEFFAEVIYTTQELKDFIDDGDDRYKPVLNRVPFTNLKPVGSCGESPLAHGIFDPQTNLFNQMLVHVEFVNLSLGIAEGYELVFQPKKRYFNQDNRITGSNFTKVDNFLKRFSKCVSICLNSKTNRFIMFDYYWCGVFQIDDVEDGEIEDVKRFLSKVKVQHYSHFNLDTNEAKLTVRKIISSFLYMDPKTFHEGKTHIDQLNRKVVDEWKEFQNLDSKSLMIKKPNNKRLKKSISSTQDFEPFVHRTLNGLEFTREYVDIEKALIKFIAIGDIWSCQTLQVDYKKLFLNKQHYSKLNYRGPRQVLISIYDEYYQEPHLSLLPRHLKHSQMEYGSTKVLNNTEHVLKRWQSNVEAYLKLSELQGVSLARMISYGYLEDKPYNTGVDTTHFKTDGYYILYEPICQNNEDLKPIDPTSETHYELCKQVLIKIHSLGLTFNPLCALTADVLKVYENKIYVINLEEANTVGVNQTYIKKDLANLDKIFNKKNGLYKDKDKKEGKKLKWRVLFDESDEGELL